MIIVQICYLYEPAVGGVESYVKNLSELLVRAGHTVIVLCSNWTDLNGRTRTNRHTETINGVAVYRVKAKRKIWYKWHTQNFGFSIKAYKKLIASADILHVHAFPSTHFFEAIKMGVRFKKPVVVHGHYNPDHIAQYKTALRKYYWKYFVIPALKKAQKYVSIVGLEKQAFIKNWKIRSDFFADIPNGINTKELVHVNSTKAEFQSRFNLSSSCKIVLTVSRITPSKGLDKVVEMAKLSRDNPEFFYLVIGKIENETYYQKLQNTITDKQLSNIKLLEAERKWVISAFQYCDFFVFPSHGEVFGIVLAEAMYCSKLCLASPYGGISDVIQHQKTGIIVENNDPVLYYKYLLHYKEAINERKTLEQSAHLSAKTEFDWDNIFGKVEKLYYQYTNNETSCKEIVLT